MAPDAVLDETRVLLRFPISTISRSRAQRDDRIRDVSGILARSMVLNIRGVTVGSPYAACMNASASTPILPSDCFSQSIDRADNNMYNCEKTLQ